MKRAWRFLRSRRVREGPAASGSSGGDELRPQGREGLCREAVRASESSGGEAEDVRAQIPTAGSDSSPSHLSSGSQQTSESIEVQRFLNECDRRLTVHEQTSRVVDTNKRLSQQLSDAERKASGLEKEVKQLKKALTEKTLAGSDSSPSRLSSGSQQTSQSVDVQMCQRAYEQWLRMQEKVNEDIIDMMETNKHLSQQLSDAERKASGLEKEVEQLKDTLWEKSLALKMAEWELRQAQRQAKEQQDLHLEKDQARKDAIKKAEGLQEQLAQLQSENLSLRQQLEAARNKSAQEQMRAVGQLQAELADAFKQHFIAETSLKASTRQCDYLTKENSRLQEDLDKTKAKMCEVSAQLKLESQKSLQLEARNQELRRLVALLPHGSATPGAGHTPAAPYGKECERRAQDVREEQYHSLLLQTQAAARAKIEEINTTSASWRKLLEQRIRTLEAELERARSTQEANALQLAWAQAEIKSSEKRSVVDMEIKRHLTKKLQKANEMLAEARAKSAPEQRRRVFRRQAESLSRSRGQSGHPSGSDECKAGSAGDSSWTTPARPPNVSELLQEREQINKLEQKHEDLCTDERMYEEQMAKVVFLEEQIKNLRDEQELLCSELLESNKKREELEKQLKESNEEKRLLLEEIAQLKQDILTTREQGDGMLEEILRMNQGMAHRENRFLVSQSSAGSLDGSVKQSLSDERFQQQEEKMQQLRQDLRRVQNLCSSAERELRYEREKNVDLQKQNLLLQQECTKVKAELKQARAKLSDTTETCSSLSAQWEKSQQKVKELEQELSKCSQADKLQSSLQEKLAQEKSKVCEAQKKISKLQQKLKDSQHQLLLVEARVSDKKLLEEELKEARENEARVQQELHEEQLKRKLLEQQVEELRQQLRHSRETEASLAKMHKELQAKTLHVLEDERKTDSCEHLQCQKENQKLSEQLSLLKEENKALYEEGVRLLNQKDLCVRKYNEMQLRHKDKIRRAKETFIHEVKQRDSRIKQLENELSESKLQVEKGKVLIAQITAENEKLLQESRRLLQKITDQEETPWSNRSTIATLQNRVKILDEENVRLHESKLQLSGHMPTSQRVPRSIHAPNTEDSKSVNFSERQLQSKVLPSPRTSFPSQEPPDSLSTLKATQDTKPEGEAESQDSSFCLSPSQPSEIGYLNVASPGDTTASQLQEESQSISSENF